MYSILLKCTKFHLFMASILTTVFFVPCLLLTPHVTEAAGTYKTYYVPVKITKREYFSGGNNTYTFDFTYYTGDKAGLLKSRTYLALSMDYSRNSNGVVTSTTCYQNTHRLISSSKATINKGKVTRLRENYYYSDGKLDNTSTSTFTYRNGRISKIIKKETVPWTKTTTTFTYRSNGVCSKRVVKYGNNSVETMTYNTKGLPTKEVKDYEDALCISTYKYSYDNKGNPTKITMYYSENGERWYTVIITNKFTYKDGNITRVVSKRKQIWDHFSNTVENKTTYSIKYKKVNVKKKYWNLMDGRIPYTSSAPSDYHPGSVNDLINYGQKGIETGHN